MLKTILRFLLVWLLAMLVTPHVTRLFDRLATRAPTGSFLEQTLLELSDRYASSLVHTFGETLGELVLGD